LSSFDLGLGLRGLNPKSDASRESHYHSDDQTEQPRVIIGQLEQSNKKHAILVRSKLELRIARHSNRASNLCHSHKTPSGTSNPSISENNRSYSANKHRLALRHAVQRLQLGALPIMSRAVRCLNLINQGASSRTQISSANHCLNVVHQSHQDNLNTLYHLHRQPNARKLSRRLMSAA
jgi:hypothetical protein